MAVALFVSNVFFWRHTDYFSVAAELKPLLHMRSLSVEEQYYGRGYGINDELEAYNPLIPDGSNWKATFMVEFPEVEERRAMLTQLIGIEDKVYVQVDGFDRVFAIADEDLERSDEHKTSAVHFMRFELPAEQVDALKSGAALAAGIDHENYRVEIAPLPENVLQSLIGDLA